MKTIGRSILHNAVHSRWRAANGAFNRAMHSAQDKQCGPTTSSVNEQIASTIPKLLIDAQEDERQRIGRDLHDGVGQEIALLIMKLQLLPRSADLLDAKLLELRLHAEKIGTMVRNISHHLHPPELDYLGLKVAVESLCRRCSNAQIEIGCVCSNLPVTPNRSVSLALYRALQEALHNVLSHSQASFAIVQLQATNTELLLRISDNGIGFKVEETHEGMGLLSMKERIAAVGGSIGVHSSFGAGTNIQFRIPLLWIYKTELSSGSRR